MSDTTPDPTVARGRHDTSGPSHEENLHGFAEAARLWALQQGLPVRAHGRVPDEIIAQYRRRQTRE